MTRNIKQGLKNVESKNRGEDMEINMEEYKEWAQKVQNLLVEECDIDWKMQYENYAKKILKNMPKMENGKRLFRVRKPLECYLSLGKSIKGSLEYDLRYRGQSVGTIYIDKEGIPKLFVDKDKCKSNEKYFGYEQYFVEHFSDKSGIIDEPWSKGKKAEVFRRFFRKGIDTQKLPHSKEHLVEARLFQEFAKTRSKDKQLVGIQPIKFANTFTHMKTAVKASKSNIGVVSISDRGGEIDIFCRRNRRLTVIEVKDKEEKGESFKESMKQAISYAVFIRELIHTPCGEDWMKIWGINDKKREGITINAVVAIPTDDEDIPNFDGQVIELGSDKIELYYMALEKSILEPDGEVSIETTL